MYENQPRIRARLDRTCVLATRATFAHLIVDIEAPKIDTDAPRPELPLNLGVVIDASGSMDAPTGSPDGTGSHAGHTTRLEAACRAARGIVQDLEDRDVLSLVSFADEAIPHLPATPLDQHGRAACRSAMSELTTRGCTDLNAGWLLGAEQVHRYGQHQSARNRLLVLSDGYANRGITEPDHLASTARGLLERGIATSTVGVGMDYSTEQLEVLAESGGGMMHHAEQAEDIVAVIMAELQDMRASSINGVEVALSAGSEITAGAADGVEISAVGYPGKSHEGITSAQLGSLIDGAKRTVVFRIDVPASDEPRELPLSLAVTWTDAGGIARTSPTQSLTLTLDPEHGDPIDRPLGGIAAQAWLDEIVHRAMHLNRLGDYDEIERWMEGVTKSFRWYARQVKGGRNLTARLRQLSDSVDRPIQESYRKEIQMSRHKSLRGVADHRVMEAPADWSEYLHRS